MTKQKKGNYTFYMVSISLSVFLMFFLQTFLLVDGTNVFMAHFTNWAATQVSLPITIGGYISIVTTFLIGSWLIRHKGRGMMLALILITGIATIALAFSEASYPLYFVAMVVINITAAAMLVLGTAVITNWFSKTRGRVLGFVTIGAPFSIRTENDTCVVAILDERACHRGRYKAAVKEALPKMPTTDDLDRVQEFILDHKSDRYFREVCIYE